MPDPVLITASTRYCLQCWYILDGLVSKRCPECGRPFDLDDPKTFSNLPREQFRWKRTLRVGLIALLFVPIEIGCVSLAYETLGEVLQALFFMILIVGNLILLLSLILCRPRVTASLLVLLLILLVPPQIWLGARLFLLNQEARRIVAYLQDAQTRSLAYPAGLSGYRFGFSHLRSRFEYVLDPAEGGYQLTWWVLDRGISHWYTPKDGWQYYPD